MPVPLHAPPSLTHRDGLPPFSIQRVTLAHSEGINSRHTDDNNNSNNKDVTASSCRALQTTQPSSTLAAAAAAPAPSSSSATAFSGSPEAQGGGTSVKQRIDPRVWTDLARVATTSHDVHTAVEHSSSSSASSSSSTSTEHPPMESRGPRLRDVDEVPMKGSGGTPPTYTAEAVRGFGRSPFSAVPLNSTEGATLDGGAVIAVPPPVLVEQQRQRICELVHERDSLAETLRELRELFHRLNDDYERVTHDSEARQLQLDSAQAQQTAVQEELVHMRDLAEERAQRISQFETEWGERSKHLRLQLDALTQERDAMQSQRDVCMSENSDLRRQLIQLQGELYAEDVRHREALREQASTHAQDLRAALQEKEEQLQVRAAATRHEARLAQQQLSQLGVSQTAAQEDREALRWRLSELEAMVEKKERLRGELERLVASLRAHITDLEHQSRNDAQRYTKRAQELEQTYQAQLHQEQHRCQTLQDELVVARRALHEAHRQHEAAEETHAARTRELAERASKQEDALREQLRVTRVELTESQELAARHEAASRRSQREAESLRISAATQQEQCMALQESHAAQAQQLLRAEGRAEVLKTRLREKEQEAELLRCTMEQTAWTAEMQEAMQHTLASVLGMPRAAAVKWLQKKAAALADGRAAVTAVTPRLEWPGTQLTPPSSPERVQDTNGRDAETSATGAAAGATHVKVAASLTHPSSAPYAAPAALQQGTPSNHTQVQPAHHAAAELNPFHSPVRSASASTQAAMSTPEAVSHQQRQDVETIDRTTARPTASPISLVDAAPSRAPSMPHTYAAASSPPLHPGTATTTAMTSMTMVMSTPASATRGAVSADASATHAASSPFPLRTLSFTSGHAAAAAARPSPSRTQQHQYNVTADEADRKEEEEEARREAGGEEGDDKGVVVANGGGNTYPRATAVEEVFFDDVHTPSVRRAVVSPMVVAAAAPTASAETRGLLTGHRTALAQLAYPSSFSLASTPHHRSPMPIPDSRSCLHHPLSPSPPAAAAASSMPGARAAELLAQLPPSLSDVTGEAAQSLTSTVFSSASAAAARRRSGDPLSGDETNLQQYLQETVQQVLADQRHGEPRLAYSARRLSTSSSQGALMALQQQHQQQQHQPQVEVVRGHSHFTQLYDGSTPLRSVQSERATEEDFGSVSQPHSVLSTLPWQQPPRAAPSAQTASAAVSAGAVVFGVGKGQHTHTEVAGAAHERPRSVPNANLAASHTRSRSAQTHDRARRRVATTGVADTLEQLARRQRQLLQSLKAPVDATKTNPVLSFSSVGGGGGVYDDGHLLQSTEHPQEHHGAPPQTSADAAVLDRLPSNIILEVQSDEARDAPTVSEVTGSDAVLDPRQLSYATAATTYAATDASVHVGENYAPNDALLYGHSHNAAGKVMKGGAGLSTAPRSEETKTQQPLDRSLYATVDTAATPPQSAPLLLTPVAFNPRGPHPDHQRTTPMQTGAQKEASGWSGPPPPPPPSSATAPFRFLGVDGGQGAKGDEASVSVQRAATDVATAVTGTTTVSVLTSVSDASSLTQLERRFAQRFEQ